MADHKLIGQKLGDYTIQSRLGQGGMAEVFKGYDENLQRFAALKVIEPRGVLLDDELEYRERFMREARAIARLHHPRVVGVYQFGKTEDDNLYYMAMVFIEGQDLRHILKEYARDEKKMGPAEILRIMADIGAALDYAHSQGVIHRDVKPSNIMVTGDGHAVLTDFGLALSATEGTLGNTFGSVHYIAPEQAVSSAQATAQSDLYSLGIVLYEILTGKVPFDDASAMNVALKHIQEPPEPPSRLNPQIPPAVEAVIMKALDKDPHNRFTSGAAFVRALDAAFATAEEEDTEDLEAGALMPPPSDRRALETPLAGDDDSRGSSTSPRKPTRQVNPPADADPRAILGGDDDGRDDDARLHIDTAIGAPASRASGWALPNMGDNAGDSGPRRSTQPSIATRTQPGAITGARERRGGGLLVIGIGALLIVTLGVFALLLTSGGEAQIAAQTQTAQTARGETQAVIAGQTGTGVALAALASPTLTATTTPTRAQTETAPPSPTLTRTSTASPTSTPTPTHTATLTPTPTATLTNTLTATATITPTLTPSLSPTPRIDGRAGEPQLLLRYDARTLVIYNRAGNAAVEIFNLDFAQGNITFDTSDLMGPGTTLPSRSCAQVWVNDFVELPRDEFPADICQSRRAFGQTGRTFWISTAPGATFTVKRNGRTLATCPAIPPADEGDNRCLVDLE